MGYAPTNHAGCGPGVTPGCGPGVAPVSAETLRADTLAYIAAVLTGGGIVSDPRSLALDALLAGQAAGTWGAGKALQCYFWDWSAADANKLDALGAAAPGTFAGGVTHNGTGVTGNGVDGKFTTRGGNLSAIFSSVNACGLFWSSPGNMPLSKPIGGRYSTSAAAFGVESGGSGSFFYSGTANAASWNTANRNGLFLATRTGVTEQKVYQLRAGVFSTLQTSAQSSAGTAFPVGSMEFMNLPGSTTFLNTALDCVGLVADMNATQAEAFMRAVQAVLDS